MKKIFTLIASVVIAASTSAFAQNMDFGGGFFPGDMPSFDMAGMPAEMEYDELANVTSAKDYATEHAIMLNKNLDLTEDQYNKVFKIYKTEAQTYINSNAMSAASFNPMGGMTSSSKASEEKQKRIDKRNKKMADVLTPEQFNMYLRLEASNS